MSTESPYADNDGIVNVVITLNGQTLPDAYQLASVKVYKEVNRIPKAYINVIDGDIAENKFAASNDSLFAPGVQVAISAGYGSDEEQIFSGIITRQSLSIDSGSSPSVEIECMDSAVKMTVARNSKYYLDKKDSDIISELTSNSGLSATVDSTSASHKQMVQYYCTDWDFMLLRAEVNGLIAIADEGKITVSKPKVSASPVLKINAGDSIINANLELNSVSQISSAKSLTWDLSQQALQTQSGSSPSVNSQGNISSSTLAGVLGVSDYYLQTSAAIYQEDDTAWADAQMQKSWLSKIKGTVNFPGSAKVVPGCIIDLDGVGELFNGSAFVSSVTHKIENGNWNTEAGLGLNAEWFAGHTNIQPPAASGLISPMQGLQIGIVKQIHQDPDGQFRVMIKLPLMQDDGNALWARMATFYATQNAGNFFYPEVNDEVLVGFLNDDPRCPVILGSMYSSKNSPALTPDEKNSQKAFITKANLQINFNEEDKVITIKTPGNNTVTISDKDKSITLADQNNNTVVLNNSGIKLDSASSITLTAQQDIKMNATGNVKINATQNVDVGGMNISESAQMKYSAQGQAQAEVTASGQLSLKGGIVMIN